MKKLIHDWNKASLIKRILIGMFLGGILGLTLPAVSGIGLLGDLFVGGLKAIAPILVFALVDLFAFFLLDFWLQLYLGKGSQ